MFTGLVQAVSKVRLLEPTPTGARLDLELPADWVLGAGESVAVNGCCLTVLDGGGCRFDLSRETLARTSAGSLKPGSAVNLERALCVGDALGGHLMAGHVDGLALLLDVSPEGEGARWRLRAPAGLERFVAHKGSVALDGVSLTPFDVEGGDFQVALIPHTLLASNLGARRPGDALNFEADVLARYVERLLGLSTGRDEA
ncbi:MAG: riboflavin synthase [bacterium]